MTGTTTVKPLRGLPTITLRFAGHNLFSVWTILFSIGLPVGMYLMFGNGQAYSLQPLPHGNVAGMILINMAQYSAVVITAMAGATIGMERIQGWLRTMALTPLGVGPYVVARALSAVVVTAVALAAVYLVGYFTDAKMDAKAWVISYLMVLALSLLTALLGLFVGLAIGGEQSYGVLGGGLALLGFLSGMFVPLDQLSDFFQTLARYTPLWGMNQLAQLPLVGWDKFEWEYLGNVAAWTILIATGTWWSAARATNR